VVRTENHDRFGLAVLLLQMLFVGRHPFQGLFKARGDPTFDELIAQYRFAHGPHAAGWHMAPPPHTPIYSDVPPDLFDLFHRAFEHGSGNGTRPTAVEWVNALQV